MLAQLAPGRLGSFSLQGLRKMVEETSRKTRLGAVLGGVELHNCTGYVSALVREKFLAATGWFVSYVARLLRARQVAYSRSVQSWAPKLAADGQEMLTREPPHTVFADLQTLGPRNCAPLLVFPRDPSTRVSQNDAKLAACELKHSLLRSLCTLIRGTRMQGISMQQDTALIR